MNLEPAAHQPALAAAASDAARPGRSALAPPLHAVALACMLATAGLAAGCDRAAGDDGAPSGAWAPARTTSDLVLLHTNDNWGETEPCG